MRVIVLRIYPHKVFFQTGKKNLTLFLKKAIFSWLWVIKQQHGGSLVGLKVENVITPFKLDKGGLPVHFLSSKPFSQHLKFYHPLEKRSFRHSLKSYWVKEVPNSSFQCSFKPLKWKDFDWMSEFLSICWFTVVASSSECLFWRPRLLHHSLRMWNMLLPGTSRH